MIKDTFGRTHTYLRISLTDNCNLRCFYCMPEEEYEFTPHGKLMQADEIFEIAQKFVALGVNKIRLTGGEPLVRKDFATIIEKLATLPVLLSITTNGILLDKYAHFLWEHGVRNVNVSLDTLDAAKFEKITRRNTFDRVWRNLNQVIELGFTMKLNVVLMRNINSDEIIDFIQLTEKQSIEVRFIEFMPFDKNNWSKEHVFSEEEVLSHVRESFEVIELPRVSNFVAKDFQVKDFKGSFGMISTMTSSFCSSCNRMRLTADGKMKNCLFSRGEVDLLTPFREGEAIDKYIHQAIMSKEKILGGQLEEDYHKVENNKLVNRSMIAIGG